MNPGIALRYFKRIYGEVTDLSRNTGYSRFYHLFDYLSAFVRHGAHIRQYIIGEFWRLSNAERSRRVTFYRMIKLEKAYNNPKYIHILSDKCEFNEFFKDLMHRGWLNVSKASFDEFKRFLLDYRSIIIKPKDGMQGNGIRRHDYNGEDDTALQELYERLRDEQALVEEVIVQHPAMVFGNTSVNTIRAMSICGPDGKGRVMKALLRAGVGNSLVDNYAMGGSIYEVDLKTGVIISYGKTKKGELHFIHPQTDIVMLGYRLPNWEKVIEVCERAAELIPQVGFVGWDVAITPDGVELIEGNNSADYELYEYLGSSGYYEKFKAILKG